MRGGRPIRVCLFGDGSNVHLRRWAVDVAARGYQVAVLSVGAAPPLSGVFVHGVAAAPAALRRLVSAHDARRFLRRFAPQIVHVHFVWHGVRSLWPLGVGRLVVSPYGTDVEAIPAGLAGVVARRLVRITLAHAHALVTSSDYLMARTLELGAVPQRAIREVIGFGVDAGRFAAAAARARQEGAEIVIGFAKGLRPYYGAADLLEAVARLRVDGVCVRLRVAGHGPSEADLRQRATTLGLDDAVEWLGHISEGALPDFFAGLDLFAMPSHREAYGVAALEAASAGVAVVATRVGGIAEVVAHGESGLLVPPRDPAALADALGALARDPARRRRMGAAGQRLAHAHHDRARAVDRMLAVYERVLAT